MVASFVGIDLDQRGKTRAQQSAAAVVERLRHIGGGIGAQNGKGGVQMVKERIDQLKPMNPPRTKLFNLLISAQVGTKAIAAPKFTFFIVPNGVAGTFEVKIGYR